MGVAVVAGDEFAVVAVVDVVVVAAARSLADAPRDEGWVMALTAGMFCVLCSCEA